MSGAPKASGVILAGGASSRMGRDKLALKVGGVPLIRRVYDVLAATCEEVLVAGAKMEAVPEARFVPDLRGGRMGPLAGMEAGFSGARHPLVFVAAGDMPFVPEALVEYLLGLASGRELQAVVPRYGKTHPLCAAYSRDILPQVSAALDHEERAVWRFLERLEIVEYVEELEQFGEPELFLMNVNTPQELERARAALGMP